MVKHSLFLFVIFMVLMPGYTFSQEPPSGPLSVQAGITVFNDPSGSQNLFVEFPFSIKRSQFEFLPLEGTDKFKATIFAELILSDTLGNHIDSANTYFYTFVGNRQETTSKGIKLFNYLSLLIEPGTYKALLSVIDVTSKNKGSFIYDRIEIDSLIPGQLSLSNIELAHDIEIVGESSEPDLSPLIKNGYKIIPNPMGMYFETDSNLFIYAELYNLDYNPNIDDSFNLAFSIYEADDILYQDYGVQTIKKPGAISIISNVISISEFNSGRYLLKLDATDLTTGKSTQSSRQFVIFSKSEQLSDVVATSIFSPLDTASIETKTNWIRFLADPADLIMFGTLNDIGKSEFISQFFNDNDPTPGDNKNEYLEDLIYRFNFANTHFSSLPELNDGWRSDRGRILLQNGQCNNIKDAVVPSQSSPLQIWYYYFIEGGVYFVFQDTDEFDNFQLVHSNKQGERFDKDWEFWIKNNVIE